MRLRPIAVALCLLAPALAHAQDRLPEAAVAQVRDACLVACGQTRPAEACSRVCACAAQEVQRNWTMEDLTAKAAELKQGAGSVRGELQQIVAQCAERVR